MMADHNEERLARLEEIRWRMIQIERARVEGVHESCALSKEAIALLDSEEDIDEWFISLLVETPAQREANRLRSLGESLLEGTLLDKTTPDE